MPVNTALARPLVPAFIRLKLSANSITLLSLLFGLLAGIGFSRGTPSGMACGGLGFLLANLMDECDGKVARQTNTASRLGAFLDTVADCVVHVALFLGLGVGLSRQHPAGPWLFLGWVAAGGSILSFALDVGGVTPWQAPSSMSPSPKERWGWVIEWLRIDFSLLVLLSALLGSVGWILWAGAIGVFLFWLPSTFFVSSR
ncbi:MAG: CDP-alcohol phosphatidyltransferase family protein [Candidatus Omnitrophica bacterium]|nr:CDP-alcohol phosphatidyltransferase family protein [Candidatus Omnitrophota bacterium]